MPSVIAMTQSSYDPASRFRLIQYVPALEGAGWRVELRANRPDRAWSSGLRNRVARGVHYRLGRLRMKANRLRDIGDAARYDVAFVQRDLAGDRGLFFARRLRETNPRFVFDFDDALFVTAPRGERVVRWMCEHAAWVTPGNAYLAEYVGRHTSRWSILPTVVDTDAYATKEWNADAPAAPMRVGWSGSDSSITHTLFPWLPAIAEAQRRLGFEFVIVTNTRPTLPVADLRWTFHPWTPAGDAALASRFDVGLMPLRDDEFQRGKCGLKLLQYMAAGLPTVGSPVGVNAEIVRDGETGFLFTTPEALTAALAALSESPELRARMGQAGRARVEAHYSLRRWLPDMVDVFSRAREAGVR